MAGLWQRICPLAARFRYYSGRLIFNDDRSMPIPKSFFRVFTESGPLIALAVAVALLVGIAGPASAQFFNFGMPQRPMFQQQPPQQQQQRGGGGWLGGDLFAP